MDNWQFSLGQVSRFLIVGLPSAASKAKMAESLTFPASGLAAILFMLTSLYTRLSHTYQRARAYIQASFSAAAPFHWALASSGESFSHLSHCGRNGQTVSTYIASGRPLQL